MPISLREGYYSSKREVLPILLLGGNVGHPAEEVVC